MPSNFLIAYRAMPFFRQLINRQECIIIQQHLSTIFLQIGSANILQVAILFPTSLITFPNSANFNLLLKQLGLPKLLFSTFYNKLNKLTNKHAPLRSLSKRKIKRLSKPWITKGIRKSIRIKNELFFSGDRDKYKFYRNKILHLSRISKRTFYHNYFIQNVNNMKKTWEGINALIRHKKSNKAISRIKRPDNNITTDQLEIPNILNKHFASVGPQLASKIPRSPIHFSQYLPKDSSPSSSFAFNLVLPCEVEAEINSLPPNKALGLYSCPVRILKDACQPLSKPLAILLNKSVQSGIYPSKLKHAKIIPVLKTKTNLIQIITGRYRFCLFLIGSSRN